MSYDACTRAGKWGPMVLSRAGDVLMCPHMVPVPLSYWFSLAKEFSGCSPGHKGTHTRLPRTLASRSCVVSVGLPQPLRSDCVSHSLCARHAWSGKACTQASRQDTHAPWTRRDLEGGGVRVGRFCSSSYLSSFLVAAPLHPVSLARGASHTGFPHSRDQNGMKYVCILSICIGVCRGRGPA